jgi:hypothetical protein
MLKPESVESQFQIRIFINISLTLYLLPNNLLHGLIDQRMEMSKLISGQADLHEAEG